MSQNLGFILKFWGSTSKCVKFWFVGKNMVKFWFLEFKIRNHFGFDVKIYKRNWFLCPSFVF